MGRLFICILYCLFIYGNLSAQLKGDFYSIDITHSILDFRANHIGFGSVRGRFSDYEGTIYFDSTDFSKTSASLVIKVESIDTGAGGRDGILKEEFFQADKYPLIEFVSTSVLNRNNQYFLRGELSMGAFKKQVEIPFQHTSGPVKDQFKHWRISFQGSLRLNRKDYDLYYRSNDFWDSIVEDSIFIEFQVGARVYNSPETVFPYRENSIGRMASEAYVSNGIAGARNAIKKAMANKEDYNTSIGQMMRGATHLENLGNFKGAVDLVNLFLELNDEPMGENIESEFLARKAKYLLKEGKREEARQVSTKALTLDRNSLALEVLRLARD